MARLMAEMDTLTPVFCSHSSQLPLSGGVVVLFELLLQGLLSSRVARMRLCIRPPRSFLVASSALGVFRLLSWGKGLSSRS